MFRYGLLSSREVLSFEWVAEANPILKHCISIMLAISAVGSPQKLEVKHLYERVRANDGDGKGDGQVRAMASELCQRVGIKQKRL